MALVGSSGDDDEEIAALMRRFGMDDAPASAAAAPPQAAAAAAASAGAVGGGGSGGTGALDFVLPSVPTAPPGQGPGAAPPVESGTARASDKMPEGLRLLMG